MGSLSRQVCRRLPLVYQAVPEQQRLTVQLVRNSIYFAASIVLIQYGEVIAI